jgi:hypothetical protein
MSFLSVLNALLSSIVGVKKFEGFCTAFKAMVECAKKDVVTDGGDLSECMLSGYLGEVRIEIEDFRNTFLIDAMTVIRSVNVLEVCRNWIR